MAVRGVGAEEAVRALEHEARLALKGRRVAIIILVSFREVESIPDFEGWFTGYSWKAHTDADDRMFLSCGTN